MRVVDGPIIHLPTSAKCSGLFHASRNVNRCQGGRRCIRICNPGYDMKCPRPPRSWIRHPELSGWVLVSEIGRLLGLGLCLLLAAFLFGEASEATTPFTCKQLVRTALGFHRPVRSSGYRFSQYTYITFHAMPESVTTIGTPCWPLRRRKRMQSVGFEGRCSLGDWLQANHRLNGDHHILGTSIVDFLAEPTRLSLQNRLRLLFSLLELLKGLGKTRLVV